jgi:molybdopterin-guanine dinucleotide biosynthesis protein A
MTATAPAFHGAVLAGGASRRMGRDKALVEIAGTPLWRRQCDVLLAAGAQSVVVVRHPGQTTVADDVIHRWDLVPDAGPIAGLHAALTGAPGATLAVLAVDLPAVDAAWFHWLAGHSQPDSGAIARHADGFEPLAALYPPAALALVNEHLRAGRYSLQDLAAALVARGLLRVAALPDAERWRVANGNTPAELAAALPRPFTAAATIPPPAPPANRARSSP